VEILLPQEADVDQSWTEHERRRLTRLCAVLTGDAGAADDLAQETLLEAWRIRHRLVDPTGRGPWLDAIARNVCRRWRVRRSRINGRELSCERPTELPGTPYAGHDQLAELLEHEELVTLLDRVLGRVPAETREVLVARYVEELPPREIATRLALSPEAVSMRLTRGRARIRELLETELADEPLAQVWVGRHGAAWRPTRLSCPTCGRRTTSIRRDRRAGEVQLRCEACEPTSVASAWRIDNPVLGPHLAAVTRPSAVVHRMSSWSHGWWPTAIATGSAACTRCGADVAVVPYEQPEPLEPRTRCGWHATCAGCGEALSTSLLGLALSYPESRVLRSRRPRAHAVPTRRTEHAGRPALEVGLRDDASGDGVDLLVDVATMRPVAVVATR
jgi:RNA polymerase sigma-70 factor (ECF subfamily)